MSTANFLESFSPAVGRLIAADSPPEQIATGFRFTEGPLWNPREDALLFSDIPANRIMRWKEGEGATVFREPSGKSNGLTWDLQGLLVACEHAGRRISRTLADGSVVTVADRYGGRRLNSPNDLVIGSDGPMYFSDPPYGLTAEFGEVAQQEQELNGLYMVPPGAGEAVRVADDFERPNGLAFTPDERLLYVADTPRYLIRLFEVNSDGTLANSRPFAHFEERHGTGRPDGMKVDIEGNLYTTGPGGVWILDPAGTTLGHLRFPEKTANLAWGDADYRSLYVCATSSVYRLQTLVPGIPAFPQ